MGLTYQIPHNAQYLTKTVIVTGTFNNPSIGVYDFGSIAAPVDANTDLLITDLQKNKVYLIDRVSIGGTISEADYLESINILPEYRLKRLINRENIYFQPYSVVNYLDDSNITAWVVSEKRNDSLLLNFTGVLDQIPATIGRLTIKLHITFSIFIISSTIFYGKFRDALSDQTGDQVRGGVDASNLTYHIAELVKLLKERG